MFSELEKKKFKESALQATRWYFRNQNSDTNPWGGMRNSSDNGRFVYEYYPATQLGRGAGIWAQALGIMAIGAVDTGLGVNAYECVFRKKAIDGAADYMSRLQYRNRNQPEINGGFSEHIPEEDASYPRDGATGGIGMCVLYKLTGEEKYKQAAIEFAEWYHNYGSDAKGWPYIAFSFKNGEGNNKMIEVPGEEGMESDFMKGDWQAGGGLAYYYLAKITGEQKYIDDYLVPLMDQVLEVYKANPYETCTYGFHGDVPVSFGNDDFALVTLLAAHHATGKQEYYDVAKERIYDFLKIIDDESGMFPSFGGTYVSAITLKVFLDLEEAAGRKLDEKLVTLLKTAAINGLNSQAYDYKEPRVHGGFWGQTDYGVSHDRIHHRSTGYACILYSMLAFKKSIPFYHVLGWD